jgi:hypothetical protein
MSTLTLGCRYPDGSPLFDAADTAQLLGRLAAATDGAVKNVTPPWVFDEKKPAHQPQLDKPDEAGWSYVVAEDDPDRDAIIAALTPLAAHRKMVQPESPLVVSAGSDPGDWIDDVYQALGPTRPRYLLLAGDPTRLPFSLQIDLAAAGAIVGRATFDGAHATSDLQTYANKVVELEKAANPRPKNEAIVFATDGGTKDPTYFSHHYMASPIISALKAPTVNYDVTTLVEAKATKAALLDAMSTGHPAFVFTASHGAGQPATAGLSKQRAANGAPGCALDGNAAGLTGWDWLLADELPAGPLCPGGMVVQFACFSYGTSSQSGFSKWLGGSNAFDADSPFVASLPMRLLANPDGPVAFVGHVDVAVLHGFDDPANPIPIDEAHPRLEPFLTVVRQAAVELAPVGYALREFHERASKFSSEIVTTFDELKNKGIDVEDLDEANQLKLIDKVIRRNDAMNFLLFGDPAARIRVSS